MRNPKFQNSIGIWDLNFLFCVLYFELHFHQPVSHGNFAVDDCT